MKIVTEKRHINKEISIPGFQPNNNCFELKQTHYFHQGIQQNGSIQNVFVYFIPKSRCQCAPWAAINSAGQDVSVTPGYSERVINLPIPALLVLKQQI